jgi:hypothetical protein
MTILQASLRGPEQAMNTPAPDWTPTLRNTSQGWAQRKAVQAGPGAPRKHAYPYSSAGEGGRTLK